MDLEQIKSLVEEVWEYKLNLKNDRKLFMEDVSMPIEEAIAHDDKTVIDYLLGIYPIERFFLQIAIKFGCECNPAAEELYDKLAADEEYNNAVFDAMYNKCGAKEFCGNAETCTFVHENLVDGMSLHPKEVELYKKYCDTDFSEYEPDDETHLIRQKNKTLASKRK